MMAQIKNKKRKKKNKKEKNPEVEHAKVQNIQ